MLNISTYLQRKYFQIIYSTCKISKNCVSLFLDFRELRDWGLQKMFPRNFLLSQQQKTRFLVTSKSLRMHHKLIWRKVVLSCACIPNYLPSSNSFFQVHALFCEWIKKNIENWSECVIVAPDEGACKRCTAIANDLNLDFALINNRNKGGEIKYYLV